MRTLKAILIVVLTVFAFSDATAQIQTLPSNYNYFYFYPLTNSSTTLRAYSANTTDTLPNAAKNTWFNSSITTLPAGASLSGLRFIASDSAYAYIYIDAKDGATWTNAVYTDSFEVDVADTIEYIVRGVATERLAGRLAGTFRVRINFQNVTQGTSSATYRVDYLWKP